MSIKLKVIISMISIAFLAAMSELVLNSLLFSYFIDSNRLVQKTEVLLIFIFTGLIIAIVFLGLSIPLILMVAKNLSAPIEKMLDKTNVDPLTGVYNRRYLDENLKNLIGFMSRSGGQLTLMMIEIDFFQRYNDTYGYNKGDTCLKIIANTLSKGISRTEDFIARYGGKEFAVVLPNTDENGARIIAQKLISLTGECKIPHEKSEAASHVTISIGIATGKTELSRSRDDYIKAANEMLNKSIQEGCNRYTLEIL